MYGYFCKKRYFLSKLFPCSCTMWKVVVHGTEQKLFLSVSFLFVSLACIHIQIHYSIIPGFEVLLWVKSSKVLLQFQHNFKSLSIESKILFLTVQWYNMLVLVPSGTKGLRESSHAWYLFQDSLDRETFEQVEQRSQVSPSGVQVWYRFRYDRHLQFLWNL